MMHATNIETDDYKAMSKTTTQIFQPLNMLNCQIILTKNRNLTICSLKKKPITRDYFCKLEKGFLFEMGLEIKLLSFNGIVF